MSKPSRLTCEETFRRLNDYLDRALSPEETDLVARHLAVCAECASEYQFEESWMDEMRSKLSRIRLPNGLLDKIERQLEEQRQNHDRTQTSLGDMLK